MKKIIMAMLLVASALLFDIHPVFSYDVPEAYMGFSVSNEWLVFSKNMTDESLLSALGVTADEVNETLVQADCEYLIINPKDEREIYVKVKKNDLSEELYNISETEDQVLKDDLSRILQDGFSVDGFDYDPNSVTVTAYPQMKFITVPGVVAYDGRDHGTVFGATFVNGSGIAFIMYLDNNTVDEEGMAAFREITESVSFTVIKEKDSSISDQGHETDKTQSALSYISGGFGGLALVALCFYLIERIKTSERKENNENRKEGKNNTTDS